MAQGQEGRIPIPDWLEGLRNKRTLAFTKADIQVLLLSRVGFPEPVLQSVAVREDLPRSRVHIQAVVDPLRVGKPTPQTLEAVHEQMVALLHECAPCGIDFRCSIRVGKPKEDGPYR